MTAEQTATRKVSSRLLQAEQEMDEIRGYVGAIRHELDSLWYSARDATAPNNGATCTDESNREIADGAAFEVLQCLHHLETHLLSLSHAVAELGARG